MAMLCLPAQAHAQTLVDAAKRAEEQRKQAEAPAPSLTHRNLPGGAGYAAVLNDYVLATRTVSNYQIAWMEIVKLRTRKPALDLFLMNWERSVKSPFELEEPYATDPDLIGILNDCSLTPHSYWMVDTAYGRALEDEHASEADVKTMSSARQANITFIRKGNEGLNWIYQKEQLKKDLDQQRRLRPRK